MSEFFFHLLNLTLEAAPWLLVGLIIGGIIKAIMPLSWLERHLKGSSFRAVLKAALLGAPLPLCSCGVIPAAIGLRRAGASKPATVSFLVSTPETGVDSISVTYAMLGPVMTIIRPIVALLSAITAGIFVGHSTEKAKVDRLGTNSPDCCESKPKSNEGSSSGSSPAIGLAKQKVDMNPHYPSVSSIPVNSSFHGAVPIQITETDSSSCCSSHTSTVQAIHSDNLKTEIGDHNLTRRIVKGLNYSFYDLFKNFLLWLSIGLVFSAAVKTWLPADFLKQWGSGLLAMLVMILISVPMYVCATASTPIAAGLMLSGISPGTALVFLMAGPASNIGSIGIIARELGNRALYAYLAGVIIVAIVSGLLLDYLIDTWQLDISAQLVSGQRALPEWIAWASLIVLGLAVLNIIRKRAKL